MEAHKLNCQQEDTAASILPFSILKNFIFDVASHSLGMDDSTSHESETSTDSADPWWLFSAYLKKAVNGDPQKTLLIRRCRWCSRPRRDCSLITNRTPRTAALLLMMKKDLLPKMLTFQENRCFSSKFSQRSPKEQL